MQHPVAHAQTQQLMINRWDHAENLQTCLPETTMELQTTKGQAALPETGWELKRIIACYDGLPQTGSGWGGVAKALGVLKSAVRPRELLLLGFPSLDASAGVMLLRTTI
jgi:hypothetical protein